MVLALFGGTSSAWAVDPGTSTTTGSIGGTVTTGTGAAVSGGWVTATDPVTDAWGGSANTDINGDYQITGLAPGNYVVQFHTGYMYPTLASQWWNGAPSRSTATPITVTAGGSITGISAVLAAGGSIGGVVTSDTGAPGPNVMVSVYEATPAGAGDWIASGMTDASGAYLVSGLPADTYKVQFSSGGALLGEWYENAADAATATPLTVASGQQITANGVLTTGASITGVVTDSSGNPVENALVMAQPGSAGGYGSGTSTAADGSYSIVGLQPGAYQVQFLTQYATQNVAPGWWKGAQTEAKAKVLTLAAGSVASGISPRLDPGATISGTVTDASGSPIPNAQVAVFDSTNLMVEGTWTGADGSFAARGLSADSYRLEFTGQMNDGSTLVEWWKNAATLSAATPITVKRGQSVGGFNIDLSPTGGAVPETGSASLSGVVTDGLGHPLSGATVIAESAAMGDITMTDANGAWSIPGLVAGTYRVSFSATVGGSQVMQWWNGASSRTTATPIALSNAEQRTDINAALGAGALPPVDSSQPKITGPVRVGSVVSAQPRGWTAGTTFTYQWYADGAPIGGATAASFAITPDLVDKQLTVLVTGSKAGYQSVARSSAPTAAVLP
ncbi:MSCRAMM family protein [Microbacterium sp. ASV49]|uniref:Carboxypeptidase-like regulatory domain-containing protein n=1 Tax=Microbacterium candidum TaxID=3041922 RepID=A0ABT7MX49_9MICO|nr:carboxypeptidase-like regulatory domain-containing protein [Microbacterium sp. ASV49]MDL9979026.1 carboxypeptidase-like regulatory domain-containing protein [Microbacterium sp. ASV49]